MRAHTKALASLLDFILVGILAAATPAVVNDLQVSILEIKKRGELWELKKTKRESETG